ncbi:MAG: flagellar assembly protein FliW [Spirochaetaceae bacterium]|nr:MAG: flagellar assembly protein FliW [Spirochaetaceae bacterium]
MKIQTKAYGEIEVDARQKIVFPSGLLGFERLRDFVLMDSHQQPFYWLQSMEIVEVAFVMIDPLIFRTDYLVDPSPEELEDIEFQEGDELLVFSILTIPAEQRKMTANLQGPVVINKRNRLGKQLILNDERWLVRHHVFEELARTRAC